MYFYLPEVKDRTLEEIDEMVSRRRAPPPNQTAKYDEKTNPVFFFSLPQFEAKVPARKFRKYVCVGRTARQAEKKEAEVEVAHAEDIVWSDGKVATEAATAVA